MSAPLKLRKWQGDALPLALDSLEAMNHGAIVATTGAGKSIFLAALLLEWRKRHGPGEGAVVVTTPSKKLVEQLHATLAEHLGGHIVGKFFTASKQDQREVVVCCNASVKNLAGRLRRAERPVAVWIADEMHKTESKQFKAKAEEIDEDPDADETVAVAVLEPVRRLGLTATPFRSNEKERIQLFDSVVYRYPPAEALRDGVIVPWRIVPWGDDRPVVEVDEACATLIKELGDRATRGPGVTNARTIEDAEDHCVYLARHGLTALPIHSGLSKAEQAANVEALRTGQIDCLVHVNMLVEGVDYPWLRWGCLRRAVGARVRFIQELGRYLRASEGKVDAAILDPNNLFDTFGVSYEEALGWAEPESGEEKEKREKEAEEEAEMLDSEPEKRYVARTTALSRYVRQLHLALIAEGVCSPGKTFPGGRWEVEPASEKQIGALRKMVKVAARLGPDHRAALGRIADTPGVPTKKIASSLLDLLHGVRKLPGGEVWKCPVPVPIPPDVAFERVADPKAYVGAAMRGGWSAVAIVRDRELLFCAARPSRRGDTWATLAQSGAAHAIKAFGATAIASELPDVGLGLPPTVDFYLAARGTNVADGPAWREIRAKMEEEDRRRSDDAEPADG